MNDFIKIYTDGSAKGNPGPGGYGIVLKYKGKVKEIAQGYRHTTNNRMELLAVIVALESLKTSNIPIQVFSDSKYVIDSITKRWVDNWKLKQFKGKKNNKIKNIIGKKNPKRYHFHFVPIIISTALLNHLSRTYLIPLSAALLTLFSIGDLTNPANRIMAPAIIKQNGKRINPKFGSLGNKRVAM